MATTRIMPLHVGKGRTESRAISDIIDYVANPQKTDNGKLITGYACDSRTADAEFLLAKRQYIAATGRVRGTDDVIAYHVRQSFRPGEITQEEANRLGVEFAKRFTKGNHAFVVCTHIDKSHIHNHIIWSSVSLEYDRKFRNFWGSTKAVRRLSDTICIENGLSIVENPKPHGKSYNKWLGDQAKPSHRELLRVAIDNALSQSPANFEELLKLLQESGCEVSKRGKSYRLKLSGWEKAARMDSLGEGYGLEDLRAVLLGKKAHTPRKKTVTQAEPPKVNLLVDIQAKLQAGKGAGYARWAKVFNLKQMAQTMNYLSEHNLLEYAVLEEKAAAATAHHNELSAQIKAAEKRMAEIAVLRTHIVNYAKTREVYSSKAYNELIQDSNLVRSMAQAGKPTDNPVNEALNGWIKEELFIDFRLEECRTRDAVKDVLCRYVAFYNRQRPCFAIGYDTPDNYCKRFYRGELEKKDTFSKRILTEEPKFVQKRKDTEK